MLINETVDNRLNDFIRQTLQETIQNKLRRERVGEIVSEHFEGFRNLVNEAEGDMEQKRKSVMTMLKDTKFNHAQLAYSIYHPKDKSEEDTYRSLFSKKATGTPDADGAVRHFTDDEINSLYELLRAK